MQASGLQRPRRAKVLSFANHTPRSWEISPIDPSQSPGPSDMFGASTGSDLHYLDNMGQAPSAAEREEVRKASSAIFREDSIVRQVEVNREYELPPLSREDSWSMHCAYTDQAPYSNANAKTYHGDSKMMTSTSMLHLPKGNASKELVDFLRRTGPPEPHRRPSKIEHPRRTVSAPKSALKMLKLGGKRQVQTAHDRFVTIRRAVKFITFAKCFRLNNVTLRDEGGLLAEADEPSTPKPLPPNVEQKVSSTGIALTVQVFCHGDHANPWQEKSTSP